MTTWEQANLSVQAHSTLQPCPTPQLPKIKQKPKIYTQSYNCQVHTHTARHTPSISHSQHTRPDRHPPPHTHTQPGTWSDAHGPTGPNTLHHIYSQTRARSTLTRCGATLTGPIRKHRV